MNKVWVFDIDGTLADNEHRMHHLDGKKEWDAFFAKQHLDEPYQPRSEEHTSELQSH